MLRDVALDLGERYVVDVAIERDIALNIVGREVVVASVDEVRLHGADDGVDVNVAAGGDVYVQAPGAGRR